MRTINHRYVRPMAFTSTAIIALVVIVIVIAQPNGTSGSAQPTSAFAATRALDRATGPFAAAHAVTYSGTVTTSDLAITIDALAVSAAGDAAGTIGIDGGTADYRQAGSAAVARGPEKFWRGMLTALGVADAATRAVPDTTTWAHIDLARFPDLGTLLTPSRLAAAVSGEQTGDTGGSDAIPDTRSRPITDPVIRRTSATTLVSGDTTVTTDDEGTALTAVRGLIGAVGTGSEQVRVVADVRVGVRDASAADAVYRDLTAQSGALAHSVAPAATVSMSRSTARPAPGACIPPSCDVDVAIIATGPDPAGSLTVVATATVGFALRGRPVGRPCARTVIVGRNAAVRFRCPITALPRPSGAFVIRSTFTAAVYADTAPATIAARLTADRAMSTATATGGFGRAGVKAATAARYGTQITGLPSHCVYDVGGYAFDGRAPDGVLLVTHGPGYSAHLGTRGLFQATWAGTAQLVAQASAQKVAAGATPVRWVFAESDAATAATALLATDRITGIAVVTVSATS